MSQGLKQNLLNHSLLSPPIVSEKRNPFKGLSQLIPEWDGSETSLWKVEGDMKGVDESGQSYENKRFLKTVEECVCIIVRIMFPCSNLGKGQDFRRGGYKV